MESLTRLTAAMTALRAVPEMKLNVSTPLLPMTSMDTELSSSPVTVPADRNKLPV